MLIDQPNADEVRWVGAEYRDEQLTHTPCRVSGAPCERGASASRAHDVQAF